MKDLKLFLFLPIALLLCGVSHSIEQNSMSKKTDSFDSQKPENINDQSWSNLKAAIQEQKLFAAQFQANAKFGISVSLSGDRALVGASGFNLNKGTAYIFEYSGVAWNQTAELVTSTNLDDNFGYAVSLKGDRALIGAYGDTSDQGAVYIFDLSNGMWSQPIKLQANLGTTGDQFGYSVSLGNDRAIIGANQDGAGLGSVYVFDLVNGSWNETQKLTAPVEYANAQFGYAVSLDQDRAAVGAIINSVQGGAPGAAYIYDLSGGVWSHSQQLIPLMVQAGDDRFGTAISLLGDRVLIGANKGYKDNSFSNVGVAYIFDLVDGSWGETEKLFAPDAATDDKFGVSVFLSEYRALIGVSKDDENSINNSGSAYIYSLFAGQWSYQEKLVASDAQTTDNLGIAVAMSGDRALVGALKDDIGPASNAGSAYTFTLDPVLYAVGGEITGLVNGNSVELENNGTDAIILSNGLFYFDTGLLESSSYAVTVKTAPTSPNQTCQVSGGSNGDGAGIMPADDYTDIVVSCSFTCETIQSGDWSQASTWTNCNNTIPQDNDSVVIKTGHTVLLDQNTSNIESLMVEVGGDFNVGTSGFTLKADTAGGDIDLSNASIDLAGDLGIAAQSHNILLGDVDGNFGLILTSQLETRLIGTIGGNIALSSLRTNSAGTTVLADANGAVGVGTIFVNGDRIFNDPVTLAQHATIQGDGGVITFGNTVDSATSTDKDLTFSNVANSTITFNGKVGNINRLKKLQFLSSSTSTTVFNTSHILTKRNQRYGTDILINSPTNNLLMNISIGGTIKVGTSSGNQTLRGEVAGVESLTIETPGVVSIISTIGDNNQSLDDFTIESTSTMLVYNDITVDGKQAYIGPMALAGDAILSATILDFRDTVDNGGFDLTLNPSTIVFNNDAFTGSGDLIKQGAGFFDMNLVSTLTGDIYINQGSINNSTNTENIFPNVSAIYLGSGTSSSLGRSTTDIFSLGNGQTLAGTGTCDCILDAKSGSIVSPGFSPGVLQITGSVAMNTGSILNIELNGNDFGTGYDNLIVPNGGIDLDADSMGGSTLNLTIGTGFFPSIGDEFSIMYANRTNLSGNFNGLPNNGSIEINGSIFSIEYINNTSSFGFDAVLLTVINQQCETGQSGNWSNASTWINCNGGIPQDGYDVIINDTHAVTLDQDTALLESLLVNSGGDLGVSGNFSLNADADGGDFDLQNASIVLSGDLTIDAQAHKILLGAVDGAFGLTLNSSDETRLLRAIGDNTSLTSITTDATGSTIFADTNTVDINTANLTVNGPRVFNDPILLANNITMVGIGGAILFNNTIDSESAVQGKSLSIVGVGGNSITFNGDIGDINKLKYLGIFNSGDSIVNLNLSTVQTFGSQLYNVNVLLNSPSETVTMESTNNSTMTLDSTITLGRADNSLYLRSESTIPDSLIITTGGTVQLRSIIGDDNQQLKDLTINQSSSIELSTSTITVDDTISFNSPIIMGRDSILNASVVDLQSDVDNAGFDLTINTSDTNDLTNITGELSGAGDFIKEGLGDMAFNSINTFSGDLLLNQGTINNLNNSNIAFPNVVNFSIAQGTVANIGGSGSQVFDLASNQTMLGKGTCNCFIDAKNGAIVSPGFSPGQFTVIQLDMDTGSTLSIELNGTLAGSEYDQLISLAAIDLDADTSGGANLDLTVMNGFTPAVGDSFTIIDVVTSALGAGTFNGLAESSRFVIDDKVFSISYVAGSGNDVVLTYLGDPIVYVDHQVTLGSDGQSWATAFNNLQDALAVAVSGMEIWVSQGVYYPNISTAPNPNDETSTFALVEGVDIYGGFNGTELELSQRDPDTNSTILSGDIDGDDIDTDNNTIAEVVTDIQGNNAYHVLDATALTDATVFDGFTVTAGSAVFGISIDSNGGAMLCDISNGPQLNNMTFIGNLANGSGGATYGCTKNVTNSHYLSNQSGTGGAVYSRGGNFENVSFKNNESVLSNGGALFAQFEDITLTNVLFSGNKAFASGGAVYIYTNIGDIVVRMTNTTISGNNALISGGGLAMSITGFLNIIDINNSIFWNNLDSSGQGTASASINSNIAVNNSYSLIQGFGITGIANLDEDPLFITDTDPTTAPTSAGNARLMYVSNAINTGDDSVVTTLYDLDGEDRIQGTVDMGAYEFTDLIFANDFE